MASVQAKLKAIYYSPRGYWRGKDAIKRLSEAAGTSRKIAQAWLEKQAIWQIYLPAPKRIKRPIFDIQTPNEVHQADILFLPHDRVNRRIYKYALTIIDVASRYKEAEPLPDKKASTVAGALQQIYKRSPLTWPNLLQVDPGKEFFGDVVKLLNKNNVKIRRGIPDVHRQQALVERFNRTLAQRLFSHQYYQELLSDGRSREWVKRLPDVIKALNSEKTRLIGREPIESIMDNRVERVDMPIRTGVKHSATISILPHDVCVRYLYAPGELEGGNVRRATDPIWSLTVHKIDSAVRAQNQPVIYYLENGPKRAFAREELQIVSCDGGEKK